MRSGPYHSSISRPPLLALQALHAQTQLSGESRSCATLGSTPALDTGIVWSVERFPWLDLPSEKRVVRQPAAPLLVIAAAEL